MTTRSPAAVESPVWGREREVEQIRGLVRSVERGARFVVIRGDAGIGKTALWRWGVEAARTAGHDALVTRPAQEDLHAPMTGLLDLFDRTDAAPGTLEPDADVFDRGRAVLLTLRQLAAAGPVTLAIDDLQWLDAISARALRYALRRLEGEPLIVLATERAGDDDRPEAVLPPDRVEHIDLGPLAVEAIRHIIRDVVGAIPRPAMDRIDELAGGNPLYATELARDGAFLANPFGSVAPPTLRSALAARLGNTSADLLDVLRTAAALGPATSGDLERACERADAAGLIAEAVEAGLLVVGDDGVVRFAHPLVASVVHDSTNPLDRRVLHARLAVLVSDADARARHLSLSCGAPDGAVAAELEAAAQRAGRRGAAAVAAELARHSLRLTPAVDSVAADRRALAEISYCAAAGATATALGMIDGLLARHAPGPVRVEAITRRVYLDIDRGDDFLVRALAESGDDIVLRGRVLDLLGWLLGIYRGQLDRGIEVSAQALAIAEQHGDPELEMLAAGTLSTISLLAGRPRAGLIERALALAAAHDGPLLGRWPPIFRARQCLWAGHLAEARERFEAMRTAFMVLGVEFQRPYRLSELAQVEVAAGNLVRAIDLGDDALEAANAAGNVQAAAWVRYPAGLARAHRGDEDGARDAARELRVWGQEHDQPPRTLMASHLLGLLALTRGDAATASVELAAALSVADELGFCHPGYVAALPDAIEASALAGDLDRCERLGSELDLQAARLGSPWVDAAAVRGRGLRDSAAGRPDAAEALGAAASSFDALGYRLDAARSVLAQARAQRRAGRRTEAAALLATARRRFTELGAEPWARLAGTEAERLDGRRSGGAMTTTEDRIADLVAAGRRNREIAAELYMSVATVEAHLTRVYRKLNMRSRTELARYVHDRRAGSVSADGGSPS